MKIGIACGGTGGHIFPGLATAEVLRRRGHEVILWLAGKDVEATALAGWPGPVVTIRARGFSSWRQVPAVLWRLGTAWQQCRRTLKQYQPDVLLAMGSYASVGPAVAARQLGIPVVLHEANVIPGRAVRFLSRWAEAVAVGFDETRLYLRHPRVVMVGMPLRTAPDPAAIPVAPWNTLSPAGFTVLVMGGSRGAHALNECVSAAIVHLQNNGCPVQVIHLAGTADENRIRARYQAAGVAHVVFGFLHNMAAAYRRATLAICRSGASTCAELSAYGVPALLIPYPAAVRQHQQANAHALETAGAADVWAEADLTVDRLGEYLRRCRAEPKRLARMRIVARRRIAGNAAEVLADLVEKMK